MGGRRAGVDGGGVAGGAVSVNGPDEATEIGGGTGRGTGGGVLCMGGGGLGGASGAEEGVGGGGAGLDCSASP